MKLKLIITSLVFSLNVFAQVSQEKKIKSTSQKFLVNVSAGPSFRLAKVPSGYSPQIENYIKNLKSGFSYDISAYYMLRPTKGIGVKYNTYNSKGTLANISLTAPNGDKGFGTTSDNITITHIGPSYIFAQKSEMVEYKFDLSIGYMGYINKSYILGDYNIKGATFGLTGGFGLNFNINKNISLGPQVSFIGGAIKEFTIDGVNGYNTTIKLNNNVESLWRIDLGLNAIARF